MLNRIIDFSIRNKLIIGLFTLALVLYGSFQLTRLPIDAVPDITNNQVQVITVAPALGATDIERLVTVPIEQLNNNIPGLIEIRSFSRFGLSLVTIVFDDATDIYWARQQVTERLQQVQSQIPQGMASISLGPVTTGLGEIYQYVVRPKKGYEHRYSPTELRTIQDWIVRRQLLGVKGVADVSSFGGFLKQYEIAVDPARLRAHGITISEVFDALEKNNANTGGSYIEKGSAVQYIRTEGLIGSMADIGNITIKNNADGSPLLIRHVADVHEGHATRYGALCYNSQGEVAGAVVMMLKGANSSRVIADVKERVKHIQQTLPEGVVIEPFLDRTKMVNNAIGTVQTNLLEGALIVLVVLIVFLGDLRAGLLVASVIPLAMLFAVILMNTFGVIGNLMSLGALDFGLIVDGSVFIVEAVLHGLAHSRYFSKVSRVNQQQMDEEVSVASGKMARSVVFGQLIILIVYLPTFALSGIEGKMFIPMAQTVIFALLGAFILSLTYVPMMSALFLKKKKPVKNFSDRMMGFFEKHYRYALGKVLRYKKTVVLGAVLLFIASIGVLTRMGGEFIPALEEGDFAVETRVLSGSSLSTTIASTQQAARILKEKFPEVQHVVTKIGSGEIPTDPMPMDAGDMIVNLKDKSEWTSARSFDELAEKMTEAVAEVPGITVSFQFPVQMRFNELMTGAKQDVVCKIFGDNMDTLAFYAKKLAQVASTVEGTGGIYVEPVTGSAQIVVQYNRQALAQYGISIDEVNRVVNTGLAGQTAGLVYEGERRFDLVVRLSGEKRQSIEDIKNLPVPLASGAQVPLYQLAQVELKQSPNQVQRENARRRIIVGFNVRGRDVQSIVTELQQKNAKQLKLPAGYGITYGGAFENLNAAKERLSITVPVSLLLIFLLLFFSFNSVKQGLLIYSAIPLSAVGGIFALAWRDMPFSISAGVGFIALFGVAVLNGIVLVAEFNRLRDSGIRHVRQVVLLGTRTRLRPVLMTGFVASLGFLPMAVSNGSGAEVQRPLATVVIGGLLIATLLTLFVLPVLYMLFEKGLARKRSKKVLPLIVLFLGTFAAGAQTPITLDAAIDTALHNNLGVKNKKTEAEYHRLLIRSAADVPAASLGFEYGNINSAYTDTKAGLVQTFDFPTVYSRQKKVLKSRSETGNRDVGLKETELKKQVGETFSRLLYLQEKKQLLVQSDSLYAAFLEKATQRFSAGESDALEISTARLTRAQVNLQLMALETELEITQLEFSLLLNSPARYTAELQGQVLPLSRQTDTAYMPDRHPLAQVLHQQKQTAMMEWSLEKSKLLPSLSLGYSNMSIRGMGADNVFYTSSTRFQTVQLGVGIPLFFGSQRSRIHAAKLGITMAETGYAEGMQQLRTGYLSALAAYERQEKAVRYIRTNMLEDARTISEAAGLRLSRGEIGFLDWVLLNHQAIGIRSQYIESIYQLNLDIIQLNYHVSE